MDGGLEPICQSSSGLPAYRLTGLPAYRLWACENLVRPSNIFRDSLACDIAQDLHKPPRPGGVAKSWRGKKDARNGARKIGKN